LKRSNIIALSLAALLFTVFVASFAVIQLFTDWLWFKQIGYVSVFSKILSVNVLIALVAGLAFFVFFFANALIARRISPPPTTWQQAPTINPISGNVTLIKTPVGMRYFGLILFAVSAIFALFAGINAAGSWDAVLKYLNQVPFGVKDPLFGLDVSFHMFSIPFYRLLISIGYQMVIFSTIMVAAIYAFSTGMAYRPGLDKLTPHIKAHLSVLIGLFFALLAVSFKFGTYDLLLSPAGVIFGAGYTDIHARIPAYTILMITSLVTAALFLVNIYFKGWKLPIAGMTVIVAVGVLVGGVYPAFVQQYLVSPNEIQKETPYIKQSIKFTNLAYNLNAITEKPFSAEDTLDKAAMNSDKQTIDNIRLWDWQPLLKTFNQIQSIRLYYDFTDVDVDRYEIDGRLRQVGIAARELNTASLPDNARTWVNEHLVYTHGYGVVANKVNELTDDGLPKLITQDIPPKTSIADLKVTRPEIYFGETQNTSSDFIITNTKTKEFDYPMGSGNKYTTYSGQDGVGLSSMANRLAFAWRFGTLKLLLSDSLTDKSRIMFYRNIEDRVKRIAPFLTYEDDPYIVVDKGRLYWMVDAYTTASRYPYAHPYDGDRNYIRNSVKVVVDAYNGTVNYYVFDPSDPIVKTYRKIFPELFKDASQLPSGLRAHIRYPVKLFTIQSKTFAQFHMADPQVFYNKEDLWTISQEAVDGTKTQIEPYYMEMRLPSEKNTEFMLLNTFTPSNKDNMIAWFTAKCNPDEYGKMLVYTFPKQKLVYGPMQIEARINQTPDISQQLSLWNQQGSRVIRGNIFVIPVKNSIIYVEPLYLQSEQTELPQLKRVIVAYGPKIAMEPDLATALDVIFGKNAQPAQATGGGTTGTPSAPASIRALIDQADQLFNDAQAKQRSGDWASYGEDMKKLEAALSELKGKSGK
jgi:hypothetical protein